MSNDHDGTDKARESDPSDLTDATADDATADESATAGLTAADADGTEGDATGAEVDGAEGDSAEAADAETGNANDADDVDGTAADPSAIEVEVPAGSARDDTALVAATAGSARAAARRSTVRAGTTAPKGVATAPREGREKKDNVFVRFARFLREVVAELGKVIWPTRKEMITYTVVVIVFVVFMVALVAGLDVLFAKGVLAVFG